MLSLDFSMHECVSPRPTRRAPSTLPGDAAAVPRPIATVWKMESAKSVPSGLEAVLRSPTRNYYFTIRLAQSVSSVSFDFNHSISVSAL